MYFIQRCFICRPSDSAVSEDAGIEQCTILMPCNVLSSKPAGLLKDYVGSALKIPNKSMLSSGLFVKGEFWIMVRQWAPTWPPPSPLLLNNNNNIWVPNLLPPYCITPFLPPPSLPAKTCLAPSSPSSGASRGCGGWGEDLFQGLLKNCRNCCPVQSKFTILLLIKKFPPPPPFLKDPLPAAPLVKAPLHHSPPPRSEENPGN